MPKKLSKSEKKELQNKLFNAAETGDLNSLKECLARGADINADRDMQYGTDTVMCSAIKNNRKNIVIYLIEAENRSLFEVKLAIEYKQYNIAKLVLIGLIADLNDHHNSLVQIILASIEGIDDPDCAAIRNIIAIQKRNLGKKLINLVRQGVDNLSAEEIEQIRTTPYLLHQYSGLTAGMDNTFLLEAILRDNTWLAKRLINLDSEKKSLDIAPRCYMANNTPLVLALKRGNVEVAQDLILAGADVNKPGFRGFTPLHWACLLRLNSSIELLLANGANPNLKNAFGRQAVDYYLTDISTEDISLFPTQAIIPGKNIEREDIAYNATEVLIKPCGVSYHREPTKHDFSTKVPDYSDLYWHMEGILRNMGLDDLINRDPMTDPEEKFSFYGEAFSEIRNQRIVQPELVSKMKSSTSLSDLSFFSGSKSIDSNERTLAPRYQEPNNV